MESAAIKKTFARWAPIYDSTFAAAAAIGGGLRSNTSTRAAATC